MSSAPARYPGQPPIEAYGDGGFRFAGGSHKGSLLCLRGAVLAWEVTSLEPHRRRPGTSG